MDDFAPGRAVSLGGLVAYAPGAVVSRTLVDKDKGTVTLFAFDADQGLSEHSTPYDALVLVLDGRAGVTVGGNPVEAAAGETVLLPANVPHSLRAVERFKMLLIMIRA